MSAIAIRTENLTRDFKTVRALDGLSLEVPAGVIYGFLGPNGSGKTTTINLLLGLLEPTAGRAEVLGFDVRTQAQEVRTHTGALLEDHGLYEHLSAEDNLEFFARAWNIPARERQARIEELLRRIDMWERRKERVGTWSRGMKQKLALARAVLHRPALIILDEPTAGLDVPSARTVRQDVVSLVEREGVTVFLTTHNMVEAQQLCREVAVIRQGKLVAVGRPDELRARAASPRLEIVGRGFSEEALTLLRAQPEVAEVMERDGHLDIDLRAETSVASLVKLMVDVGVKVEEVHRSRASLEEVFLALVEEVQ